MSWDRGLWWPFGVTPSFPNSSSTLDATGEIVATIGKVSIEGKATGKTLDTSGSSAIRFCVGIAPIFDNASSVFTVGLQGVDKTTGFPVRPNGTWGARAVITTAANTTPTLTTTSSSHLAVPTAGSSTLNHGDEVAFVLEMTTKAGSDVVVPSLSAVGPGTNLYPGSVTNVSGSWLGLAVPGGLSCEITFSDGTLGTIDTAAVFSPTALTWTDSTNPDEQGLIFQVPFACTIDAIAFSMRIVDATSDMQFDLTSDPTGTPVSLLGGAIALLAENLSLAANETLVMVALASDITLNAATDYCVSLKATAAGSVRFNQAVLTSAAARIFTGPGGTTVGATTRNGGSGAFAAMDTTKLNPFSVRISSISAGAAGGLLTHPGMSGGMRG